MIYDPEEHRPLSGEAWTESRALAAIDLITREAIDAYQGPELLWPNAVEDLEGDPDVPFRNAYFGAAGVVWGLDRLARAGVSTAFPEAHELASRLHQDFMGAPELTSLEPPPAASLMFGESGILLAAEAILGDGSQHAALESVIGRNVEHSSLEMCWGSPGTMIAALALFRATGAERWRELWLRSAEWLLGQWTELVWVQLLYGNVQRWVGAGHGFAGNALSLLSGIDLLSDQAEPVTERIRDTMVELAHTEGELAQWFPLLGEETSRIPVQWCHGSPGIVTSLIDLPPSDGTDRLLRAGAELTWHAGPLRKNPGLCHGTAGNGYAFLAARTRFGDELWLDRARAFAMDAAAEVERKRRERGRGRFSLYTGDIGVALFIHACLTGDRRFPFLEVSLDGA